MGGGSASGNSRGEGQGWREAGSTSGNSERARDEGRRRRGGGGGVDLEGSGLQRNRGGGGAVRKPSRVRGDPGPGWASFHLCSLQAKPRAPSQAVLGSEKENVDVKDSFL